MPLVHEFITFLSCSGAVRVRHIGGPCCVGVMAGPVLSAVCMGLWPLPSSPNRELAESRGLI